MDNSSIGMFLVEDFDEIFDRKDSKKLPKKTKESYPENWDELCEISRREKENYNSTDRSIDGWLQTYYRLIDVLLNYRSGYPKIYNRLHGLGWALTCEIPEFVSMAALAFSNAPHQLDVEQIIIDITWSAKYGIPLTNAVMAYYGDKFPWRFPFINVIGAGMASGDQNIMEMARNAVENIEGVEDYRGDRIYTKYDFPGPIACNWFIELDMIPPIKRDIRMKEVLTPKQSNAFMKKVVNPMIKRARKYPGCKGLKGSKLTNALALINDPLIKEVYYELMWAYNFVEIYY